MYGFFLRIGKARDATHELMGVVVFRLHLRYKCSHQSKLSPTTKEMKMHELFKQHKIQCNLCIRMKHTMIDGDPFISAFT
jgi:hypothetical protein